METKTQTYLCPTCQERQGGVPGATKCWNCGYSLFIECNVCQPLSDLSLACYRRVVGLPVIDRADPTQAYRLTCGHTVI